MAPVVEDCAEADVVIPAKAKTARKTAEKESRAADFNMRDITIENCIR
jgi:hypothetical protein